MELSKETIQHIKEALIEDLGDGDHTSETIFTKNQTSSFHMVAKQKGVFCGIQLCERIFQMINSSIEIQPAIEEGAHVKSGQLIMTIKGSVLDILKGERLALNFVQYLSGISTRTHKIVNEVAQYPVKILDTRKTMPIWRELAKYAVRTGGGTNHRMGLYDMIMIKDNHIDAAGGISQALEMIRKRNRTDLKVEIEVRNHEELQEVLNAGGADIVMLDNMSVKDVATAVDMAKGKVQLEASGGMTMEVLKEYAATGVDFISMGILTHSVEALDISLIMKEEA